MKPQIITSWDRDIPVVFDLVMAGRIVAKSPEYLKKLAQQGKFPAVKVGAEWRCTKDAIMKYLGVGVW